MRTPASSLLLTMLAGTAVAVIGACTTTATQTPSCIDNVGAAGIEAIDGGCEGFATCYVNGAPAAPETCCAEAGTGVDFASCVYGFGGPYDAGGSGGGDAGGSGGGDAGGSGGGDAGGD
jgi:hypothetical protein